MRRKRAFYDNPGIRKAAQRKEALRRNAIGEIRPQNAETARAENQVAELSLEKNRAASRWTVQTIIAVALLSATLPLLILRLTGIISVSWLVAILPLSIVGFVFVIAHSFLAFAGQSPLARRVLYGKESDGASVTPPPDRLEAPLAADGIGESILAEHPELLAALCLGFRMKRLVPNVLGKPVTDAWGVYKEALLASSLELQHLQMVSRMHLDLYSRHPRLPKKRGQKLSDADLMRHAVEHFRRCAEKTTAKGGPPDCPFEHVVVVFASRAPSRDAQLRSIAPRVRSLLEHQYPQIRTAIRAGEELSYSEWQKQAVLDKQELDRERRERERTLRKLEASLDDASQLRDQVANLKASVHDARDEARAAARADQARVVDDLRDTIERASLEHNREVQRLQGEIQKQLAQLNALTKERDDLERALLSGDEERADDSDDVDIQIVSGMRVLLIGGDARQVRPVREYAESVGIQLLHEDSVDGALLVESVDMVVFWIRYLGHPKYYAVRRECRVQGKAHSYWTRTSPASLVSLIARARTENVTLTNG